MPREKLCEIRRHCARRFLHVIVQRLAQFGILGQFAADPFAHRGDLLVHPGIAAKQILFQPASQLGPQVLDVGTDYFAVPDIALDFLALFQEGGIDLEPIDEALDCFVKILAKLVRRIFTHLHQHLVQRISDQFRAILAQPAGRQDLLFHRVFTLEPVGDMLRDKVPTRRRAQQRHELRDSLVQQLLVATVLRQRIQNRRHRF